jgi:hypothetical protein
MMTHDGDAKRLDRLRGNRNAPDPDLTLGYLAKQFKQQVERPHKQLGALTELWQELVPPQLLNSTRLDGISRGVLRVSVDTSSHLFQLDRLLRSGLQRQIINQHPGKALRRIQLRVDTNAFTHDTRR